MSMGDSILICSQTALNARTVGGGADRLMLNISDALSNEGWDVHVLCPKPDMPSREQSDINFHNFRSGEPDTTFQKIYSSIQSPIKLRDIINGYNIDIVLDDISHIPYYPAHIQQSAVNCAFLHVAYFKDAIRFTGPLNGRLVEFIDHTLPLLGPEIICAGNSTLERFKQVTGYNDLSVLNPCVDLDKFEYKVRPDSKRLLYLGRLTERKNVSLLLDAWGEIDSDDYTLSIAGTGYQREELQQQVKNSSISNVEFLGFVSDTEKVELLRDSLAFVFPSTLEGYPITGLEALASGTPVIGADSPGINDYIRDGFNGLLFDPGNKQELKRYLRLVIENPYMIEQFAQNGRETVEKHSFREFQKSADALFNSLSTEN